MCYISEPCSYIANADHLGHDLGELGHLGKVDDDIGDIHVGLQDGERWSGSNGTATNFEIALSGMKALSVSIGGLGDHSIEMVIERQPEATGGGTTQSLGCQMPEPLRWLARATEQQALATVFDV
jgi:hypothetical protein